MELLISASSFSLNSIHFKKKFNKIDYVLSPNDIIYLIKKIESCNPTPASHGPTAAIPN